MIETNYFILTHDQYHSFKAESDAYDLPLDYFLLEFCDIQGEWVDVED